ncbi:MAG: hypothetical protein P4L33_16755 [Capsulimonadaceae bacterium]|nr:hypothetical protein [Capsulimonadaceae bacterium]
MIVGVTSNVELEVYRSTAWQASSGGLGVTAPDGTVVTQAASIFPAAASEIQTLASSFTPAIAGRYGFRWSYTDGTGASHAVVETRFATFTDAKCLALTRLQRTNAEVRDALFERELASVARSILLRWPQIGNGLGTSAASGNYAALALLDDQANFDEAAALMVCVRLVGPLTSGGAASDLAAGKAGDEQYSFAPDTSAGALHAPGDAGTGPGGYGGAGERRRWLHEAAERIGAITWVSQAVSARGAFNPFRVNGPSRAAAASGRVQTLLGDVIELLTDKVGVLDEAYPDYEQADEWE